MKLIALCLSLLPLTAAVAAEEQQLQSAIETCMMGRSDQEVRENCHPLDRDACKARYADQPFTVQLSFCYGDEIQAWRAVTDALYTELLALVECTDPRRLAQGYPAAAESLRNADAAWKAHLKAGADAEFVSLRWGAGTLRIDDPQRFVRDQVAERALLYREWLAQPEWICN